MPSQKDNLDDLLNGMSEEKEERDGMRESRDEEEAPDLDDLTGMSEEEIDRLLSAGEGTEAKEEYAERDVLDLLEEERSSDLQEIQDMLRKSDNNEAVDGQASDREELDEMSPADRLLEEIEEAGETEVAGNLTDAKAQKALDKKRRKEEKKAAKEAAKAEKQAKKKSKKGGEADEKTSQAPRAAQDAPAQAMEYDVNRDKDLLDSIISGAGHVEQEKSAPVDLMEVAQAMNHERGVAAGQEVPYQEASEEVGQEGNPDSGVMALGLDEIDAYIPDITKGAQEEEPEKKKGLMSRFMKFLTEEEEQENENVPISEENQEIIKELDEEKAAKIKAKPKKKKKPKKKEAKKSDKKKKAKPPKPKKEKKPKEAEPYIPGSRLSFKRMLPILLLGLTVGAVTFIFVTLTVDFTNRQEAKQAFEDGDYKTCYTNLHGKKLSESEEEMYNKSECILHVRMWYLEYESLEEEGDAAKILDRLIQAVNDYPELSMYAARWNALLEVHEIYTELLDILYTRFGVTETQAQEIAALSSDIEYTKAVLALTEGGSYGASELPGTEAVEPETELQDILPEEELQDILPDEREELQDELPEESELGDEEFQ